MAPPFQPRRGVVLDPKLSRERALPEPFQQPGAVIRFVRWIRQDDVERRVQPIHPRQRFDPGDRAAFPEAQSDQIIPQHLCGPPVGFDKMNVSRTARQRLDSERARTREEIGHRRAHHGLAQRREPRLSNALPGRTRPSTRRGVDETTAARPGDDAELHPPSTSSDWLEGVADGDDVGLRAKAPPPRLDVQLVDDIAGPIVEAGREIWLPEGDGFQHGS